MKAVLLSLLVAFCCCVLFNTKVANADARQTTIVCAPDSSPLTVFAAQELRRYVYLRTGELLPIVKHLGRKDAFVLAVQGTPGTEFVAEKLAPQDYILKTKTNPSGRKTLHLVGGSEVSVLYAAYRVAEHLGVRFYLHGDVVPDEQVRFELPQLDEKRSPLFALRGIQPFHDFPEGPDWWNADEYKASIAQLPKLGMNFIGLHTYPLSEPTVWSGLVEEIASDGRVTESYPSGYFNTAKTVGWGFDARKTSNYACGAALLYDRDDYSGDVMRDLSPVPGTPEKCNEVFNRTGVMLNDAFSFAQQLGVKTCVGTETPLAIPPAASKKLGNTPDLALKVYEGIFARIMRTYPVDYYWLWTPEAWTWEGTTPEAVQATLTDVTTARQALANVGAPFGLATCGWVLGPQHDRSLLGNTLPQDITVSCINRNVGHDPVEPGFADVKGRGKWAIPWLEDDPAMTSPQLWAGRMRRDARDAYHYGCTGLMGIHWRTRILGPNVSALAHAGWQQDPAWSMPLNKTGVIGGLTTHLPKADIVGADVKEVYQDYRWGMSAYRIPVPNGTYAVTIKTAEPGFTEAGKRVFDVSIEGEKVLEALDIFARVGHGKALDCTFDAVEVTDGRLDIEFKARIEFPCIAGLVVKGNGVVMKINAGGPAQGDYQADLPFHPDHPATDDFYADWALHEFGPEVAQDAANIFASMDGRLPRPSDWVKGPGGYLPDPRPWDTVKDEYTFVDALAALQMHVRGSGNKERFDYWLNTMQYLRATARMRCEWGQYNATLDNVKGVNDPAERARLAHATLLPLRKALVGATEEAYRYLMATVSTTGELGTLANLEGHTFPTMLDTPGRELEQMLGNPLPADAQMSREYRNEPRLLVTAPRTSRNANESLSVRVIVASQETPVSVTLHWRPLGTGRFREISATKAERNTYYVTIPAKLMRGKDIEYYIEAKVLVDAQHNLRPLVWPASAPSINQTVTCFLPRKEERKKG